MPLISMKELLGRALTGGYAVGYFEAWDIYSLEAVVEAAESVNSPVIIGFGGVMLDQNWFDNRGLEYLGALGRTAADYARVPVCLLLNEVFTVSQVGRGIQCGFNSVMLMTATLSLSENINMTKQVVAMATPAGVSVEAELGHLPEVGQSFIKGEATLTDPDEAGEFVRQTGVTALAVSVGNVHNMTNGKAKIDFQRIKAIRRATETPLVIHGGTGFPDEAVGPAIDAGVAKFNVGAILKRCFWDGTKSAIANVPDGTDPHLVVGSRKQLDLMMEGKTRIRDEVVRRIRLYGSNDRAPV